MLLSSLPSVILNDLTTFLKPESSVLSAAYQAGWPDHQLCWFPAASATRSCQEAITVSPLTVTRCQNAAHSALSDHDSLSCLPPQLYCHVLPTRQAQFLLVTYYCLSNSSDQS